MYYILPQSPNIKLQDIAIAFKLLKENNIQYIGLGDLTTQSTLNTTYEKAQIANQMIKTFITQQKQDDKLFDANQLLSVSNMKYYEILMHEATKESIEQAEEEMKLQAVQYKDLSKVLANAACSYIPSVLKSLCKYQEIKQLYSVYKLNDTDDVKFFQETIQVQPLKANPKTILEDAASYILLEDTLDSISKKINKGFCEDKNIENNPILDQLKLCQYFTNVNYEDVKQKFSQGEITPQDLKKIVIEAFKSFWIDNTDFKALGNQLRKK